MIEKPIFLLLMLGCIPASILFINRLKMLDILPTQQNPENPSDSELPLKKRLILSAVSWNIAWICLSIALAQPTWGVYSILREKTPSSVSFVFDISYSMTAKDCLSSDYHHIIGKENNSPSFISRLKISQKTAHALLENFTTEMVSIVLTKGDGILAIPITEDYFSLHSLIDNLSPHMMSSTGSNIAKGVETAITSFPTHLARKATVIVFTDGDETRGNIVSDLEKLQNYGITIIFAGIGSVHESSIFAGDGKTPVKTALREKALQKATHFRNIYYVNTAQKTTLDEIMRHVQTKTKGQKKNEHASSYQFEPISRSRLFISVAFVFFIAGFLIRKKINWHSKSAITMIIISTVFFSSCSSWKEQEGEILHGTLLWHRKNYLHASAAFLTAIQKSEEHKNVHFLDYGLYNLACTYLQMNEEKDALIKLNQLSSTLPKNLAFSVAYNKGIIAYKQKNYNDAVLFFKNALLINNESISAKINLELALQNKNTTKPDSIQELLPAYEDEIPHAVEDALFSIIKESEEKRWKNTETQTTQTNSADF